MGAATRAIWMLKASLMHIDAFKIANTSGAQRCVVTEAEFLSFAKRAYWELRESIQANLAPALQRKDPG